MIGRTARACAVALWVAASAAALAATQSTSTLVTQGVEAYQQAQTLTERDARVAAFTRAEQLFDESTRAGAPNADLHANAGTAALQAERLGAAVLAFRRALELDPDHPRASRNLAHARSLLPEWIPRPRGDSVLDTFFFWHRSMSGAERAGAAALSFALAALFAAIAIRWRSRLARGLAALPALAWLGLMTSLALDVHAREAGAAVVVAEEAPARASDSANAPVRFGQALPGGTELEVLEVRGGWARIRLANGREAWIGRGAIEPVAGDLQR